MKLMLIIVFVISYFLSGCDFSGKKEVNNKDGVPHGYHEEMPRIVGGTKAIPADVDSIQHVLVSTIVDTIGEVRELSILRGLNPTLDSIALTTVDNYQLTPARKWGVQGAGPKGKPFEIEITFPVTFIPHDSAR